MWGAFTLTHSLTHTPTHFFVNILWLSPEPPLPPYTGGRERSRRMLEYVAARHAVHLLTYAGPADAAELDALRGRLAGLTALPYPAAGRSYSAPLGGLVRRHLETAAGHAPWDAVHVQGLTLWPAAAAAGRAGMRRVLDLFDVPVLLRQRLLSVQTRARPWDRLVLAGLRWREARALRQAGAVIVTSAHDAELLRRTHGALPLVIVPNGVDLAHWAAPSHAPEAAHILFPGALNYAPNIDAAQVLVQAVLPRVLAQAPTARLVIAGRAPDPAVIALAAGHPAVTLTADPPDMRPLLARATVVAVPLRAGSGTRLKILQALAAGRPVVSTPLGAEGLDLAPGRHLSIAPLVEAFADEIIRLLCDPPAREALAKDGPAAVAHYDWSRQLPFLDAVYPGET